MQRTHPTIDEVFSDRRIVVYRGVSTSEETTEEVTMNTVPDPFTTGERVPARSGSTDSATPPPGEDRATWIAKVSPQVDAGAIARSLVHETGARLLYVYRHVFNGFAFDGSAAAATKVSTDADVVRVQQVRPKRPRNSSLHPHTAPHRFEVSAPSR